MHALLLHHHGRGTRPSALDLSNLRIEQHGMPMHVAALMLLEGAALRDEAGALRLEEIRRHVERRTRAVERLHQVLGRSGDHRRTLVWREAPDFDIAHHVQASLLPPPGDEETLLRVCSDLNAPPLDRTRPLWDLWLLDGLADGRVAALLRLHHVVADGSAALELFSCLFDHDSGARLAGGSPEAPEPSPATTGGAGPLARLGRAMTMTALRVGRLATLVRLGRAPALPWNQPVGRRRVHRLARADLARAKAVAHRHGGKVNDVVLTAVAGGAHRLLASRGSDPDLDLHVSVAASIRRPDQQGGNRVGVRIVAVPVGETDAVRRLRVVAARTTAQRRRPPLQPSGRFLQHWLVRVMAHQRLINLVLSNMPGPTERLWFAGAGVDEMFQLSPVQGNCAIGVGVLSYAGQLNVEVVADPDVVPDVEAFEEGVLETLEQLDVAR
jgi:diacylglycerol O-acyltransferase / wax synthase